MNRFIFTSLIGLLCLLSLTHAQEVVTLSNPIIAIPSTMVMRPARLEFNILLGTVQISLYPWINGEFVTTNPPLNFIYNSSTIPTGITLITSLNKVNLSAVSLERRIINQLIASGHFAGTVSGTTP